MKHKKSYLFAVVLVFFSFYTANFWIIPEVNYLSFFPPIHPAVGDQVFWDLIIAGFCTFYLGKDLFKDQKIIFGFIALFLLIGSPAILLFIISSKLINEK